MRIFRVVILLSTLVFQTMGTSFVYAQTKLVINGSAPLLKNGTKIILTQYTPRVGMVIPPRVKGIIQPDTVTIQNHQFEFTLNKNEGEYFYLMVNKNFSRFFLQPGKAKIIIADTALKEITVSNNVAYAELGQYHKRIKNDSVCKKNRLQLRTLRTSIKNNSTDSALISLKQNEIEELNLAYDKRVAALCMLWIEEYPYSYINAMVLYNQLDAMPENEVKKIFTEMPAYFKNNVWARELEYNIDSLFVGVKAPVFSQADTAGKQVKLNEFRGKYVLIDFWASWCIYCREDSPNLVRAMQQFNNRNFTIISVSLDDKKKEWVKAIHADGLNWTHLSDLQSFRNEIAVKYNVDAIPANFLIDPEGKIIAKNLTGESLLATLSRLIK